jgi:uncharacterized membrane protein YccC
VLAWRALRLTIEINSDLEPRTASRPVDRCGRLPSSPMRYPTAVGFGVLTAIATAYLWTVVRFVLPFAVPLFLSRISATQSDSGGVGAVIGSGSILLAALLGFVGGFIWMLWRSKHGRHVGRKALRP